MVFYANVNAAERKFGAMIYFDHAAGEYPPEGVLSHYLALIREFPTNGEAAHLLGRRTRRALDACARRVVSLLDLPDDFGVLWFGGAAEAFRFAASTPALVRKRVVSSPLEHPSLHAALASREGELALLDCDEFGGVLPENAPSETGCVALHQLQSELGTTPDFSVLKAAYPDALFLVDAVQSAGKRPLPREGNIFVISGGKLGVPGGGAALIYDAAHPALREWMELRRRWRSELYLGDRLFAPSCLAIECALELKIKQRSSELFRTGRINRFLRENCAALGALPTIPYEKTDCRILHFHFPDRQGAILVRMLSDAGIMCSAGSACASESDRPSPAMLALGFPRETAYSALRLSFDFSNTEDEARRFVSVLGDVLRRY
ncbi:MAG: aminotransferase class V-fold PLP-dependent enzyme [Victivallaceae bacterium]|nr:aminotransferase class V-fold PLP-dependent enzyme [Victivallaceae bacterium]